jgi:hypothetical protein
MREVENEYKNVESGHTFREIALNPILNIDERLYERVSWIPTAQENASMMA